MQQTEKVEKMKAAGDDEYNIRKQVGAVHLICFVKKTC